MFLWPSFFLLPKEGIPAYAKASAGQANPHSIAAGRNRTDMDLRPYDFESYVSTSSTTAAKYYNARYAPHIASLARNGAGSTNSATSARYKSACRWGYVRISRFIAKYDSYDSYTNLYLAKAIKKAINTNLHLAKALPLFI